MRELLFKTIENRYIEYHRKLSNELMVLEKSEAKMLSKWFLALTLNLHEKSDKGYL